MTYTAFYICAHLGNNPAGIFNCQGNDAFVLRLDASGNFIWAVGATGAGQAGGQTIAIDAQKNIYTVGWVGSGVTDFNPDPIVANTLTGSTSPYTYFVWKLSPLGTVAVKFVNFKVKKVSGSVNLYWATEQEINSKTFIVEQSTDQRVWNEITRLNAAGNSTQKINYTATDFNPAKAVNYYRLKQIDLDGKFNYSEIRSVYFGNDVNVVLVPNPAVDKVIVYLPGNTTNVSINIYNMNGQLVKQLSSNEEAVQINVSDLSKGVYSIRVNGRNVNEVKRLAVE